MREEIEKPGQSAETQALSGWVETGWTALKLGLTSFGGPIAHIGYFREMYVRRKRWLDEETFADLAAKCQFLPGPASSQLGMAIGMRRAGVAGGLAAWAGFTLPSALLMITFAYGFGAIESAAAGLIHGLKLAAVAVVAQAVWSMGRASTPDWLRVGFAVFTAAAALLIPGTAGQLLPLAVCGAAGWLFLRGRVSVPLTPPNSGVIGTRPAILCLALFGLLLLLLPFLATLTDDVFVTLADIGYRAGSLVFGGGHVVLPMLERASVRAGLLTEPQFVAGYGAAQALPGSLFTFAAFVGAASSGGVNGVLRGVWMLAAIFLPSFLLVAGAMPFWERMRGSIRARAMLAGVNGSVVGLLLAALYRPDWTSAIHNTADAAIAAAAFACLLNTRMPPWLLVAACAAAGWIIGR